MKKFDKVIVGKVKKTLPKGKRHFVFLEDETMLSAFGSVQVKVGKTYSFCYFLNGDFKNYDPENTEEVNPDGKQPEVKEEAVEVKKTVSPVVPGPVSPVGTASTKTPESLARVTKHQSTLNGQAFGMLFNNTISILIDQGESKEIPTKFDDIFDGLKKLHDRKRKELNVQ